MIMTENDNFNFTIPKQPEGKPISAEEAERMLLEKLDKCEAEFHDALWDLAYFYSKTGRQPLAQKFLERLIAITEDPEKQAGCYLGLGQLMEQMGNFEAAIAFYSQAFSLEPVNTPTWYFINNNLGYSLNQLSRFKEAEGYCRSAIRIDPERQNAFKNLGISLAGQGQFVEAARNYIMGVRANAADGRALRLLEELFAEHPELAAEIPDIAEQIQECRKAVDAVAELQRKMNQDHK
jgi:tetratricopeptide (TPR) repeat protein